MVVHSQAFSPRLCEVIGEEQLRVALRQAMARARSHGFTNRGPIRLFIEMTFLFGSDFDTDPQYPWAAQILMGPDEQMQRAEQLYHKIVEYQNRVSGQAAVNTRKALTDLLEWAHGPITFSQSDFEGRMRQEMARIFPRKADFVGDRGMSSLVHSGKTAADKYYFVSPRAQGLVIALMFAFGHGCVDDPLYPWISSTLADPRLADSAGRADRLEKKSITWLEHVLARRSEG